MSFLTKPLPVQVEIEKQKFDINADFRLMIDFDNIANGNFTKDEKSEKIFKIISLFFKSKTLEIDKALNAFLWFFTCGESEGSESANAQEPKKSKRAYSFDADGELIYSAFLQEYRINLLTIPFLHWWEFRALLNGLSENCLFKKVIGYRTIEITKDMPKEQQRTYKKLKKLYQLPDYRSEEEKEQDFVDALDHLY